MGAPVRLAVPLGDERTQSIRVAGDGLGSLWSGLAARFTYTSENVASGGLKRWVAGCLGPPTLLCGTPATSDVPVFKRA
jgi:hypothetical protein